MIDLPEVTLIALTNKKLKEHDEAVLKSCEGINFGGVKIIVDYQCDSIDEWNRKIIYELPNYVTTSHALLIHADGAVKDPNCWDDEWLKLDFIGSPWPLPKDDYSYRSESGQIQRVGNSVSLRSKRLMELAAQRPLLHRYGNNNEDGHICCWNREWLESQGMKFATFEQALKFGKEHELPENTDLSTFVYHTVG